jgi:hypothetical protein
VQPSRLLAHRPLKSQIAYQNARESERLFHVAKERLKAGNVILFDVMQEDCLVGKRFLNNCAHYVSQCILVALMCAVEMLAQDHCPRRSPVTHMKVIMSYYLNNLFFLTFSTTNPTPQAHPITLPNRRRLRMPPIQILLTIITHPPTYTPLLKVPRDMNLLPVLSLPSQPTPNPMLQQNLITIAHRHLARPPLQPHKPVSPRILRGWMRALRRPKARAEHRHDLDDERLQTRRRRAHDGEVDLQYGPVGGRPGVPCLVFGVLGNEDEEVQANDGDDDYKPAEGEDEEERDFLAHGDLQFPELADGERGDEEVRCDV